MKSAAPLILALLLAACATPPPASDAPIIAGEPGQPAPAQAQHVDLQSYMGRWYVIAHLPDPTSEDYHQVASTLDYQLQPDGRIEMRHSSRPVNFSQSFMSTVSEARIIESRNNARWRIKTGWLQSREYLILQVGATYNYAVVGDDSRQHAWILSRQARMTDELYAQLLGFLDSRGYETSRMTKIPQIEDQLGSPGYQQ